MASACATSSCPLISAPSACPSSKRTAAGRFRRRRTVSSCRATGGGDNDGLLWLPRRDVMLKGLSGVAAGAGLAWYPGLASGAVPQCETADKVNEKMLLCADTFEQKPCPHFKIRQPVHRLSLENQEKYKEAVGKMKALPESNPLSFKAQAAIHQAYCDGYYSYHRSSAGAGGSESEKKADPPFDVHFSWIFAPWHRMYIYFYERALGQLIGDDTFALPYWNWDSPKGMVVPALFRLKDNPSGSANPLYDANRNLSNLDKLLDLGYLSLSDEEKTKQLQTFIDDDNVPKGDKYEQLVNKNLCTIYKQQQVRGCKDALAFLGEKYCTDIGSSKSSMGTLESMAHTALHVWVGKAPPRGEKCTPASGGALSHHSPGHSKPAAEYNCFNDMGFLGSAANDPLFYSHHSNVDRMWHLWSTRLGGGQGITDPDWLDASFVFYDDVESPRKVRLSFKDVLDTRNLGYTYDPEHDKDLPWLQPKITSLVPSPDEYKKDSRSSSKEEPEFPLTLVKDQAVEVPAVTLPDKEKGKQPVLVIDRIEFNPQKKNKFDVAINVTKDKALLVGPQYEEYAGSFAVVPGSGGTEMRECRICLCITDVLDGIKLAADDSTVDVVIVPRTDDPVTLKARPTIQNRESSKP